MGFGVRFTLDAKSDLEPLYGFSVEQDPVAAKRALAVIGRAWTVLEDFPFSCRKASAATPFLRELVISFGDAGYVALFEIENEHTVTVLAVRHQREDDYL